MRIFSINSYYYTDLKNKPSNRKILLQLCNEKSINYNAVKDIIKLERRRLTKEEMFEILSIRGHIWNEI